MNAKKSTVNSAVTETKSTAADAAKTTAKTETAAAKTTKPAAEKKTTVKAAKPAVEKKPAAKPAAKKTAPAKKPAAKSATAKTSTKSAAAKKPAKKSAVVNAETVCAKLEKKVSKSKASAIKEKIAADIEVYGFTEGETSQKLYIEIDGGKVTVSPHTYDAKDFRVAVSFENAMAFVDGKTDLKALLVSDGFYAEGNIAKAVKLASIF